jgi:hypothetical protein
MQFKPNEMHLFRLLKRFCAITESSLKRLLPPMATKDVRKEKVKTIIPYGIKKRIGFQ